MSYWIYNGFELENNKLKPGPQFVYYNDGIGEILKDDSIKEEVYGKRHFVELNYTLCILKYATQSCT